MTGVHACGTRLMTVGLCVGVALWATVAGAQTVPNFSGTWEPIDSADLTAPGIVQTVTHTNSKLIIGHTSTGSGHGIVYKTDGSANRSTLESHGSPIESVATVSIKGGAMTIARIDSYPDGRIRENTQVWSLNPDGNLVIASTDGLKGETPVTRSVVYRKRVISRH